MTRQEAQARCDKLAAEHPDRETHRFVVHQADDGTWDVAKIALAPQSEERIAETRADERPPTPDDPRPLRDIGGPNFG